MQTFAKATLSFVKSRAFFVITLLLFVVESAWIALSARYPMAFDEGYHLGIIQLYSHQLGPLMLHQPAGMAPYGAVTRDPSYLYHWLMSFPYRWLISAFSFKTTVICLRLINIGFFAGGLVFFRQLLLKTRVTKGVVQVALFFFVLIPIVPLLAGQVNYDNLMILILPVNLLMVLRFREQLLKKRLNVHLLLTSFSVAVLASLEKYPYLPILTAITLYLIYLLWKFVRHSRQSLWRLVNKSWQSVPRAQNIAVASLLMMSVGLFVEMYGVNAVKYHNLIPQCNQVISAERCVAYGPWERNEQYAQEVAKFGKPSNSSNDPLVFLGGWVQGMFLRTFFTINGPNGRESYQNFTPLPGIMLAAGMTFNVGLVLVWRSRRDIFPRDPVLTFLLFVSFAYVLSLLGKNYYAYLQYGRLIAINGRYMLPVLLPVLLVIGMAYRQMLSRGRQAFMLGMVFLLFLQGGGVITFIAQSNAGWYWPNDPYVLGMNQRAQKILKPFVIGFQKQE